MIEYEKRVHNNHLNKANDINNINLANADKAQYRSKSIVIGRPPFEHEIHYKQNIIHNSKPLIKKNHYLTMLRNNIPVPKFVSSKFGEKGENIYHIPEYQLDNLIDMIKLKEREIYNQKYNHLNNHVNGIKKEIIDINNSMSLKLNMTDLLNQVDGEIKFLSKEDRWRRNQKIVTGNWNKLRRLNNILIF